MIKKMITVVTNYCFVLFFIFSLLSSCNTYKNIPYFQDFPDTSQPAIAKTVPFKTPTIKPDDVLNIIIQTIDNDITSSLNTGNVAVQGNPTNVTSSAGQSQSVTGYLVDADGNVELPFIGKVKVSDLTTTEAKEKIRVEADKYFKNPIVNVRFANFKITVLGEVVRPSSFVVPNEKINVFEALGMAGDLTIYGKRENVLLLRDTLGDKKMIRLNLNSKNIVGSPYFYLEPNDIVYVEPSKSKAASTDAVRNRNITIIASALSLLIVLFARFR